MIHHFIVFSPRAYSTCVTNLCIGNCGLGCLQIEWAFRLRLILHDFHTCVSIAFPQTTMSAVVSTKKTMANEARSASLSLFLPLFLCSYVLTIVGSFSFVVHVIGIWIFGPALKCCIIEAEIVKIAPTNELRFHLIIIAGNKKEKTEVVKIDKVGDLPKWSVNISLWVVYAPISSWWLSHNYTRDVNLQTMILWELHGRRRLVQHFKVLGSVEKTLGEFFEEGSASACCISFFALRYAYFFCRHWYTSIQQIFRGHSPQNIWPVGYPQECHDPSCPERQETLRELRVTG